VANSAATLLNRLLILPNQFKIGNNLFFTMLFEMISAPNGLERDSYLCALLFAMTDKF
jgi:hypothetical protein